MAYQLHTIAYNIMDFFFGFNQSLVTFGNATYFSNPANSKNRDEITIKKSVDNAMTWSSSLLVHKGKTFGYTCLVTGMLKVGVQKQGGLLYESSNKTIAFLRFNVNMSL